MDIYAYQRPLGKIEDAPDLKKAFIKIYEEKILDVGNGYVMDDYLMELPIS